MKMIPDMENSRKAGMYMNNYSDVKKHIKKSHNEKRKNRGVTMVELIVSFALLSIFLVAATMCISHAVIFHYSERQTMSAYSVADIVFSEIKDELRTMQSSDYYGYVKIREKNASDGRLVAVAENGGIYEGTTIEFVASNINNGANAVQLDTEGCTCALINKDGVVKENIDNIKDGYLTLRYYSPYRETKMSGYEKLYMDQIMMGSSAEASNNYNEIIGSKVVWHAEEKLPVQLYQDYTVSLKFSVHPTTDSEGHKVVNFVDVSVSVNDADGEVYQKSRRVELQNTVYYETGNTLYSDGPAFP